MRFKIGIAGAALVALAWGDVYADVRMPSVLSDGVVLQRGVPLKIWGKADPGERVKVSLSGKKQETVAAPDSTWSVTLPPMKAGGPYVMTVNDKSINDVLIGDVYLCSGQSNMELPVNRVLDFSARRSPLTKIQTSGSLRPPRNIALILKRGCFGCYMEESNPRREREVWSFGLFHG